MRIRPSAVAAGLILFVLLAFEITPSADAAGVTNKGVITLSRNYATYGTEIEITVTDLDLRELIARDSETLDASGKQFMIPAGGIGQTFDVTLPLAAISDQDGDGIIGPGDYTLSIPEAQVIAVSTTTGVVTISRVAASAIDLTYTIGIVVSVVATTDLTGSPYVLSPGLKGFSEFANLPTVTPYDADGSGDVSIGDYTITPSEAAIALLDLGQGIAVIERKAEIVTPLPFSIGYQTEVVFTEDLSGDVFILPAGNSSDSFSIFLSNPPIADSNGDGFVSPSDISTAGLTGARISSVDSGSGIISLVRDGSLNFDETFSISYSTAQISTTSVQILGSNSETPITVVLTESSPSSSRFVGKIMPVADISGPEVTTGTKVPVDHGDSLVVRYTDQAPRTIVNDSIAIDTIAPTISAVAPPAGEYVFPANVEISFSVDDIGTGLDTTRIQLHLDNDKDEVTTDDGELIKVPVEDVVIVNGSHMVNTVMPDLGSDGTASWYVRVFDMAGNSTRSDSDSTVEGDQDGIVIIDTFPPRISETIAGERFDLENEIIQTDQLEWIHVIFEEAIDPASVLPVRLSVDSRQADSAVAPESMPNSLFLHIPLLHGDPDKLEIEAGAVRDLAGLKNVLHTASVTDSINPRIELTLDSRYVSGTLELEVTSNEPLSAAPSISIDGRTIDIAAPNGTKKWNFKVDVNQLDPSRASDGVKNLVVTGFDYSGNLGTAGQEIFEEDYPANAIQFEVDHQTSKPLISPAFGAKLEGWTALIRISYPGEANEYPGDTSPGAVITSATINGEEIGELFESVANGVIWEYQTGTLPISSYLVRIESADLAGNTLAPIETLFTVSTQPPEEAISDDPSDSVDAESPDGEVSPDNDSLTDPVESAPTLDGNGAPLRGGDSGGFTPDNAALGGIELDEPVTGGSETPDIPGVIDPADDVAEDVAPSDSPADDAQPDEPPTIAPEPVTASPTNILAPDLAALIDGVMAARESQLASDPDALDPDEPLAEAVVDPSDEPAIEPAPESTPDPSEDPPGLTNADVEQTATAMRDASLLEDGIDLNADEEPAPVGGGCGLPFANSNSPSADSALYAAGLLALLVVAKRPRKKGDR